MTGAARFLDDSDPPQQVDYVFLLSGGESTRPFVAASLVKAGFAGKVLLPMPKQFHNVEAGLYPREERITRQILLARGVSEKDILVLDDRVCEHTHHEAKTLLEFLEKHPNSKVAVVTNNFHTRRARLIITRELGDKVSQVIFIAAPTDGFDQSDWWHYERGVVTYSNEYVKLFLEWCSNG